MANQEAKDVELKLDPTQQNEPHPESHSNFEPCFDQNLEDTTRNLEDIEDDVFVYLLRSEAATSPYEGVPLTAGGRSYSTVSDGFYLGSVSPEDNADYGPLAEYWVFFGRRGRSL
jgi:hypothetical protein